MKALLGVSGAVFLLVAAVLLSPRRKPAPNEEHLTSAPSAVPIRSRASGPEVPSPAMVAVSRVREIDVQVHSATRSLSTRAEMRDIGRMRSDLSPVKDKLQLSDEQIEAVAQHFAMMRVVRATFEQEIAVVDKISSEEMAVTIPEYSAAGDYLKERWHSGLAEILGGEKAGALVDELWHYWPPYFANFGASVQTYAVRATLNVRNELWYKISKSVVATTLPGSTEVEIYGGAFGSSYETKGVSPGDLEGSDLAVLGPFVSRIAPDPG